MVQDCGGDFTRELPIADQFGGVFIDDSSREYTGPGLKAANGLFGFWGESVIRWAAENSVKRGYIGPFVAPHLQVSLIPLRSQCRICGRAKGFGLISSNASGKFNILFLCQRHDHSADGQIVWSVRLETEFTSDDADIRSDIANMNVPLKPERN